MRPIYTALLVFFLSVGSAHAGTTIIVNSLADTISDDGTCTLREAIIAANGDTPTGVMAGECPAGAGDDVIVIEVTGTILLTSNLPAVTGSVRIAGPGIDLLTVDGDHTHRAFRFSSGFGNETYKLQGMTVQSVDGTGVGLGAGASVINGNELTIEFVRFADMISTNLSSLVSCDGSTLNVRWSTIETAGGPSPEYGLWFESCDGELAYSTVSSCAYGGVRVKNTLPAGASRTVDIRHTTISGNGPGGGSGGITMFSAAGGLGTMTLNLRHSTVAFNSTASSSAGATGGIVVTGSQNTLNIENSVIGLNTAPNSSLPTPDLRMGSGATLNTLGHNFIGINEGAQSTFPAGYPNANTDYVGTEAVPRDPGLEALALNGGPTKVHFPATFPAASPLIDAGLCTGEPAEQQGRERVNDFPTVTNGSGSNGCDIGSVELAIGRLPIELDATVLLYGAYDAGKGEMADLSPWILEEQPYDAAPWAYPGSEQLGGSGSLTDWVLIRLRRERPDGPLAMTGAAVLLPDGTLVDADGLEAPYVSTLASAEVMPGLYYVELLHRNHVPVVSRVPYVFEPGTPAEVDFTEPDEVVGTNALAETTDNRHALWPGDADGNGAVEPGDAVEWLSQRAASEGGMAPGYYTADFNFDGLANEADLVLLWVFGHGR